MADAHTRVLPVRRAFCSSIAELSPSICDKDNKRRRLEALTCAHQTGYAQLFLGGDWNSQAHFLNALLAKPCVQLLPVDEIQASRFAQPSRSGLVFVGCLEDWVGFPSGPTRVLITLALLSNASC